MDNSADRVRICEEFLNGISPTLLQDMKTVLTQRGGKKGGLYLQGPPSCGKTIVVKLMCAYYNFIDVGIIPHTSDTDKFMFQDCLNKNILVAEELALTDIGADQLKLVLEGHFLASTETKGKGRQKIRQTPTVITANRNIVASCPWQWLPLKDRLFIHYFNKRIEQEHEINFIHLLSNQQLYNIALTLFA